ncbi:MAG TPA: helix-turn-helix domain-containing protein [Nitrososphaeraceae archaeon]|nr:helix-turn-helix domain-containing protein [Nitrososphaeraceae archaeon]
MSLELTRGESLVYTALLRLGSSKVAEIVKESRVSYSKVYDVLERLGLKGLISHKTVNKIRYFQAVEPYRLYDYIERKEDHVRRQRQKIERIIPQLSKYASMDKRSSCEIFIGEKAIRSAHEILLNNAQENEMLRYFYPYDDYHEIASPFYLRLYRFQKSKKIIERGVSTMNFKNSLHFKEIPKDVNMRFVQFPLPGTIDIFKDKILIVDWKSVIGILITSKEISMHFERYFDSVWKLSER